MSYDREEQPRSALEDLQPSPGSDEQSINYEAALELIGRVVAGYEALIDREQSKASPDAEAVNSWTEAEDHLIARRDSLRLTDTEGDPATAGRLCRGDPPDSGGPMTEVERLLNRRGGVVNRTRPEHLRSPAIPQRRSGS